MIKILMLLFLVGCGDQFQDKRFLAPIPVTNQVRPTLLSEDFRPFVEQFYIDAEKRDVATSTMVESVGFIDDYGEGMDTIGRCSEFYTHQSGPVTRKVTVLRSDWDASTDIHRKLVLYHELGHCALGLHHTEESQQIMAKYALPDIFAELNWDELVNTLFTTRPDGSINLTDHEEGEL